MTPAYLPPSLLPSISLQPQDFHIPSLNYPNISYNSSFTKTSFNFLFPSKTSVHLRGHFS